MSCALLQQVWRKNWNFGSDKVNFNVETNIFDKFKWQWSE